MITMCPSINCLITANLSNLTKNYFPVFSKCLIFKSVKKMYRGKMWQPYGLLCYRTSFNSQCSVFSFSVASKVRVPNMDEYSSSVSSAYVFLSSAQAVLLCIYTYSWISTALSPHMLLLKFWLHYSKHESPSSIIQIFCNRIIYQSLFSDFSLPAKFSIPHKST